MQTSVVHFGHETVESVGVCTTESTRCLPFLLGPGADGMRRSGMNVEQVGTGQYVGFGVLHSSNFPLYSIACSFDKKGRATCS